MIPVEAIPGIGRVVIPESSAGSEFKYYVLDTQ
jgi:hypothetical protein